MRLFILFIISLIFLLPYSTMGEDTELPSVYGQTSWGTEFFLSLPPNDGGGGRDKKVILEITSIEENTAQIKVPWFNIDKRYPISANSTQRIEVPADAVQPFIKKLEDGVDDVLGNKGIFRNGRALEVYTERPVTISVLSEFGDTGDSYLALPTHTLGTHYRVSTYKTPESNYEFTNNLPAVVTIVGTEDNTRVDFHLIGSPNSMVSANTAMGEFKTLRYLNRGDVWVISSTDVESDIGGSVVESDKPVAVISGNQCAEVPLGNPYCDFMMNMEIPSLAWGKQYVSLHKSGRKYENVLRAFPLENNTTILRDGAVFVNHSQSKPAFPQVERYDLPRRFDNTDPIILSSTKRFYAVEYGTGTTEDEKLDVVGGPSTQALMPIRGELSEAYFTSRESSSGLIQGDSYLRIIYKKDSQGNIAFRIKILPSDNEYLDLSDNDIIKGKGDIDNTEYSYILIKLPLGKTFKIEGEGAVSLQKIMDRGKTSSTQPIYLTMESEEFPEDSLPPLITFTRGCDGTIQGLAEDMPRNDRIRSKLGQNLASSKVNFDYFTNNQNNVSIKPWTLIPIDKHKDASCVLTFWDRRGNKIDTLITYTAPQIIASPEKFDFALTKAGSAVKQAFSLTNQSTTNVFNYEEIRLAQGKYFSLTAINYSKLSTSQINPQSLFEAELSYLPNSDGEHFDTILVDRGCDIFMRIPIVGISDNAVISVSDKSLGDIPQNDDVSFRLDISNLSELPIRLSGARLKHGNIFSLVGDIPTEVTPWDLASRGKRYLELKANTSTPGLYRDTLLISNDASGGDSLGIISINIKEPGLIANSYFFGRKSIVSLNDGKGYAAPVGELTISNRAKRKLSIAKAYMEGVGKDNFRLLQNLDNIELAAGETRNLPVEYFPESPDMHGSILVIEDQFGAITRANLTGIGTCPKAEITVPEIGKMVVGSDASSEIIIRNLEENEWVYGESIVINGVDQFLLDSYNISIDQSIFPLTIPMGGRETIPFTIASPQAAEEISISLPIDAELCETKEALIAASFVEYNTELSSVEPTVESCINVLSRITVKVSNLSDVAIDYKDIRLEPFVPELSLAQPLIKEFTLDPRESIEIDIEFFATQAGIYSSKLLFNEDNGSELSLAVGGLAKSFERSLTISSENYLEAELGDTITLHYGISTVNENAEAIGGQIPFEIRYDSSLMEPLVSSIKLSDELTDIGYRLELQNMAEGVITGTMDNTDNSNYYRLPQEAIDLVLLDYRLFLPNSQSTRTTEFNFLGSSGCTLISDAEEEITLLGCDIDYRYVTRIGEQDDLEASISQDIIEIEGKIAVGGESRLEIIDIAGNIVDVIFYEQRESGAFSFIYNKGDLSSGQYYLSLRTPSGMITKRIDILN